MKNLDIKVSRSGKTWEVTSMRMRLGNISRFRSLSEAEDFAAVIRNAYSLGRGDAVRNMRSALELDED